MWRISTRRWRYGARLGLVSAAVAAAASASPGAGFAGGSVPPRDRFSGRISAATGKLKGDHGRVVVLLAPGAGTTTRSLKISLVGARCTGAKHCLRLDGQLSGTITMQQSLPDVGVRFAVVAAGRVKSLGHVSARGQVHGTGFIASGYESLTMKLTAAGGTVRVTAQSGRVSGFTAP